MSHFSRIKTKIVEKEYLLRALQEMGYQYEEGNLTIGGFGGNSTRVEIKIPLRLSGDIGLRKGAEGYEIIADWWGVRGVKQKEFTEQLNQRYAYAATRARLEEQGFNLVEEAQENGEIRMVLRRTTA